MPFCAECADALRAVFGADGINTQLKAGNFYAREGGVELGARSPEGVVPYVPLPVVVGKVKRDR